VSLCRTRTLGNRDQGEEASADKTLLIAAFQLAFKKTVASPTLKSLPPLVPPPVRPKT
jgi:hypothetical protein